MPFPFAKDESLVQAICCDSFFAPFAEPQNYFTKPDVNFFDIIQHKTLPITFYDPVCGIPLFTAPVGRSLKDFETETMEHGWPSFRPAEIVKKNVIIHDDTGMVTSSCGTHLGTNLPDSNGDRYC